jgi:hypothetical protein
LGAKRKINPVFSGSRERLDGERQTSPISGSWQVKVKKTAMEGADCLIPYTKVVLQ